MKVLGFFLIVLWSWMAISKPYSTLIIPPVSGKLIYGEFPGRLVEGPQIKRKDEIKRRFEEIREFTIDHYKKKDLKVLNYCAYELINKKIRNEIPEEHQDQFEKCSTLSVGEKANQVGEALCQKLESSFDVAGIFEKYQVDREFKESLYQCFADQAAEDTLMDWASQLSYSNTAYRKANDKSQYDVLVKPEISDALFSLGKDLIPKKDAVLYGNVKYFDKNNVRSSVKKVEKTKCYKKQFFALQFNNKKGDYFIAFRGTQKNKNYFSDLKMGRDLIPCVEGVVSQVYEQLMSHAKKGEPIPKINFTGHSLGGGLAEMAHIFLAKKIVEQNQKLPLKDKIPLAKIRSVTFNSLGGRKQALDHLKIKRASFLNSLQSTQYCYQGDTVCNIGTHIGHKVSYGAKKKRLMGHRQDQSDGFHQEQNLQYLSDDQKKEKKDSKTFHGPVQVMGKKKGQKRTTYRSLFFAPSYKEK